MKTVIGVILALGILVFFGVAVHFLGFFRFLALLGWLVFGCSVYFLNKEK